jgi:signal peptidase I
MSISHTESVLENQTSSRRPRFLATLLSAAFVGPGAGHVTKGRFLRGASWFLLSHLRVPLILVFRFPGLMLAMALLLAGIIDAVYLRGSKAGLPGWKMVIALWLAIGLGTMGIGKIEKNFLLESFKLPANSMEPTLKMGDHFFVRKLASIPQRGDVIAFQYPEDESKIFIKRVLAIGGDTIQFRNDVPLLNGKPIPRKKLTQPCTIPHPNEEATEKNIPCTAYQEELKGKKYVVVQALKGVSEAQIRDMGPVHVPRGHVFVVGDNRDYSHDSRFWNRAQMVPLDKVMGLADFIGWSSDEETIRWSRIGLTLN